MDIEAASDNSAQLKKGFKGERLKLNTAPLKDHKGKSQIIPGGQNGQKFFKNEESDNQQSPAKFQRQHSISQKERKFTTTLTGEQIKQGSQEDDYCVDSGSD